MFRPDMERSLWPFWPGTEKNRDKWDLFDWWRRKGTLAGEDQEDAGYRSKTNGSVLKLGGCNWEKNMISC